MHTICKHLMGIGIIMDINLKMSMDKGTKPASYLLDPLILSYESLG